MNETQIESIVDSLKRIADALELHSKLAVLAMKLARELTRKDGE
jgi:hypothetical protein